MSAATDKKRVEDWSVDEVGEWLESIALGHTRPFVEKVSFDGRQLAEASTDDLKELGFTNLQCKKLARELEPLLSNQSGASGGASNNNDGNNNKALQLENQSLRQELSELKSLVASLQTQMTSLKNSGSAAVSEYNPSGQQVVASRPVTVITGFCSHAVIEGSQTQVLTVTLGPGDTIRAEPGAMVHMSPYITMSTKTGGQGLARWATGQRVFLTEFSYTGPEGTADDITLTPDFPSELVPIRLDQYGGKIVCQKQSLLASDVTCNITVECTQSLGAGFFGGEGFVLQGLNGTGVVVLNARGTVLRKVLRNGDRLTCATGALVAFEHTVGYHVATMKGGGTNVLFGGEGLFVTELTGPGTVWLESHDMSQLYTVLTSEGNTAQKKTLLS